MLCQEGERGFLASFSTFLFPFLHLCAKIYNFPLEKALNEERRMAYEERMYFVVADKRD